MIQFHEWSCEAVITQYHKPRNIAIRLVDAETGEPVATASVNLDELLPDGFVAIKDYAENQGIMQALIDAGVIAAPVAVVALSPFAVAHICPLR